MYFVEHCALGRKGHETPVNQKRVNKMVVLCKPFFTGTQASGDVLNSMHSVLSMWLSIGDHALRDLLQCSTLMSYSSSHLSYCTESWTSY